MAIDVKQIIADGLLKLCEEISLESITIKHLLEVTGVSRQTFYNHFLDKNDLIQYIYLKKIISKFDDTTIEINFHNELLVAFQNMKKYHVFMKQACMMNGQNCLKDFIFEHCRDFDLEWHQKRYGKVKMPETLRFATEYHATASSSMTLSWILSDMPASCEEMAKLITELRSIGMEKLFENAEINGNPYKVN
ncbi:MAG: TetR/AcrR family transcriptional regulator C-terminal domain-containing protein [Clostridium sp.]